MTSIDDEKLVLLGRERLVVHDLLEEALVRLGERSPYFGFPGFESVEGIREEVVIFSLHDLWRKGANGWTRVQGLGLFRHRMGWKSKQEDVSRPWRCDGLHATHFTYHCAGCAARSLP
jgi:hypothetical protein